MRKCTQTRRELQKATRAFKDTMLNRAARRQRAVSLSKIAPAPGAIIKDDIREKSTPKNKIDG